MTDLDVALCAVTAGQAITQARRGEPLERTGKGGADFATDVDVAVEQAILEVIRAHRPQDAVQGEEFGLTGPADAGRLWLVDPLCGTLNYASGSPAYAINVALTAGDDVLAAAVAEPAAGVVYVTHGRTAWCQRGEAAEPLRPSAASRIVEVHLETHDPDPFGFSSSRYLRSSTFGTLSARYLGTGLPLAWVASGQRAGFVIPDRRGRSVHFSAGIGLCRAAGCVCTNLLGHPLRLADDGIVVAADQATHRLLLAGIAEQIGSPRGASRA